MTSVSAQHHTRHVQVSQFGNPLRILFYLYFPGSGIGRYTHDLLSHLALRDEVAAELACLPSYHWLQNSPYPVWPGLREIGHKWPWRRKARFLIAQVANPWRLARHVQETGADIVHFSTINHLTYPLWKRELKRTNAKVVATVHDVRRAKGILNHRYETRQLQEFYRFADALFVHSHSQLADLVDFAKVDAGRVHVVPHGPYDYGLPSADRFELRQQYQIPKDKEVALFFGNIRDEKNLDILLQVLPHFQDQLHLVVAGRGGGSGHKSTKYYQELAERLSIVASVTFIDRYVPDNEVADLFTMCDWVALPYRSTFTSQSGVLNVAAAYQRPVLVSPAPTFVETLGECDIGVMVESETRESLIEGVETLQSRIDSGYQHQFDLYASRFGWEENVKRTLSVYRSLAAGQAIHS